MLRMQAFHFDYIFLTSYHQNSASKVNKQRRSGVARVPSRSVIFQFLSPIT